LVKTLVVRFVIATALLLGLTAPAVAEESYAEQVVAADAAALGVTLGGSAIDSAGVRDVGLGLSIGAAPLVHLANGNRMGAAKSLALHITLPLATSLAVDQLTENKTTSMLAFAAGMAVATAIDASTLAKKKLLDRKWRPDLGFKDGGMQLKILAKF
jgi:hypothetical protein